VEGARNMKTRETIMDIAERISYSLSSVSATWPDTGRHNNRLEMKIGL